MEALSAGKAQSINSIATPLIEGYGAYRSKKFEARQINRNATAIAAKGTRDAAEVRRQGKLMASNARAAMAGSGGVSSDAGGIEGLANIKRVTDQNALTALFESETQADSLRLQAKAVKQSGRQALAGGVKKSLGTVLSNSDRIFSKDSPTFAGDKKSDYTGDKYKKWLAGK